MPTTDTSERGSGIPKRDEEQAINQRGGWSTTERRRRWSSVCCPTIPSCSSNSATTQPSSGQLHCRRSPHHTYAVFI
ncbi:MAG: hypothetical protein ACQES5_11030 [Thermodesulfobacteriota bacterium]